MKIHIFIIALIVVVCSLECESQIKSAKIIKNNKIKVTNDGGKTWQYFPYYIASVNSISSNKSATFIKNGTKFTDDGGKTWKVLSDNISIEKNKNSYFEIFPNPVINNSINIKLSNLTVNDDVYISIYDQSGKLCYETIYYTESLSTTSINLNLSDLSTGFYILVIKNNNSSFVKQFQKF